MSANDVIVKTGLHDIFIQISDYEIISLSTIGFRLYIQEDDTYETWDIMMGCILIYEALSEDFSHKAFEVIKNKLISSIKNNDVICDLRPIKAQLIEKEKKENDG